MFYSVAMVLMRCLYHGIEFDVARGVSGFLSKTSQLRISAELESANCLATNISTVRKVSRHFAFGSLEDALFCLFARIVGKIGGREMKQI